MAKIIKLHTGTFSDGKIEGWVVDPTSIVSTVDGGGIHLRVRVADEFGLITMSVEQWCEFIDTINDKVVEALDLDLDAGHA